MGLFDQGQEPPVFQLLNRMENLGHGKNISDKKS
ncbi:hypothetical protein SAMN05216255_1319 [Pseudomonas segetis]|uniref:Uncharacterized protein n=1 Tax=Pseudomonas segetis TaxID=298908 RepID=A0A239AP57_9PSED|nr:hypothetical protein SAMN05216255_1319 [Pseudomonas segetis]